MLRTNVATRDPTRTTTLRAAYASDLRGRLREIARLIKITVAENDALYLSDRRSPLAVRQALPATRFDFVTSPDLVTANLKWLRAVIDEVLLVHYDPARSTLAVPNRFIYRAIEQAIKRADSELVREGIIPGILGLDPLVPAPIPESLARTASILYGRNYELLRGIGEGMARRIGLELSSGVIKGINPLQMAGNMTDVVNTFGINRANMIARTEVINAFAETTLDRYEQWGIVEVEPMVELSTAGDDDVCDRCLALEAKAPIPTSEARGVIPVHPQCRCAWLPVQKPLRTNELVREFFDAARRMYYVRTFAG